jgi:hypothetical protein
LRQLYVTITDETAEKLDKIKELKKLANNPGVIEFLINFAYEHLLEAKA